MKKIISLALSLSLFTITFYARASTNDPSYFGTLYGVDSDSDHVLLSKMTASIATIKTNTAASTNAVTLNGTNNIVALSGTNNVVHVAAMPAVTVNTGDINTSTNQSAETLLDGLGDYGAIAISAPGGDVGSAPWAVFPFVFNGTSWDKLRGDTNGVTAQLYGTNNVVHIAAMPAVSVSTDTNISDATTHDLLVTLTNVQNTIMGLITTLTNQANNGILVGVTNASQSEVGVTNTAATSLHTTNWQAGAWTVNVGGYTAACSNTVTIATNTHTVGMAITSGEITNFFRVNGGSAMLQTLTWSQFSQTNSDAKVFWFFSRPVTAVTNAALWVPTEDDMMYLCASPVYLGCTTNELVPFGVSGFAQYAAGLARPMVNTWTNRDLWYIVTQPAVVSAENTSNVVTTARVRVSGIQD